MALWSHSEGGLVVPLCAGLIACHLRQVARGRVSDGGGHTLRATLWLICVYAWVPFLPEKRTSRQHGMLGKTSRSRGRQGDKAVAARGYSFHRRRSRCPRLAHTAPSPTAPASLNAFPLVGTIDGGDVRSEKAFSTDLRACPGVPDSPGPPLLRGNGRRPLPTLGCGPRPSASPEGSSRQVGPSSVLGLIKERKEKEKRPNIWTSVHLLVKRSQTVPA